MYLLNLFSFLKHLFLIVRSPELSFGELYMNKELKIKKGNLEDLMKFLMYKKKEFIKLF